ncbi:hypothetical protein D0O09_32145 [Pseudomonas putida]|nr:hypothetical protein D0O09_32145 [Pseudomonas putida]
MLENGLIFRKVTAKTGPNGQAGKKWPFEPFQTLFDADQRSGPLLSSARRGHHVLTRAMQKIEVPFSWNFNDPSVAGMAFGAVPK